MDRKDILKKIAAIRKEVAKDQYKIIKEKIEKKNVHVHRSNRNFIAKKFIERGRKKLVKEIELALNPILEAQKEIDLKFLNEIERLKQICLQLEEDKDQEESDETKNQNPGEKN